MPRLQLRASGAGACAGRSAGQKGRGPMKAFTKLLRERYAQHVVEVQEPYTSKACSACGQRPLRVIRPHGAERSRDVQACDGCGTFWARDANSATNICYLTYMGAVHEQRRAALCRNLPAGVAGAAAGGAQQGVAGSGG
ncbi:hypothetical protein HYH03_008845 [Edaphochlamys debaryana]|uniref:Cas12f1-like TNB domain-containing protein n=1 Tax=Edaphochlamys debaryana TaxID=47281 RepID=A0A835Y2K3_9CHLO|nr:hypothetical protein HYH03_008845 [Edaphochlamys debaryana]|eukprot:KAG2492936.1 hypothetical protein HYH03_008845 [Edaphochlamys debaryana]